MSSSSATTDMPGWGGSGAAEAGAAADGAGAPEEVFPWMMTVSVTTEAESATTVALGDSLMEGIPDS